MRKLEKLNPIDMAQVKTDKPEKYIFLAIMAYWLTGILIIGYVFTYSPIPFLESTSPVLLASYLICISLIVFQSYCRNIGLSMLFSILLPCVPLVVGASWLFPLMVLGLTVVAWLRRCDITESIGRVGLADIATLIATSCVFAFIALSSFHDGTFFLLWDIGRFPVGPDPLFHSAVSAMIKNYGISSTGMDGLVALNYHVFSHFLTAAISFGTGLPVINTYGAVRDIVSVPLLLLTIVAAAETIRPSIHVRSFFIRILVLFIALHSFKILPMFYKFGVWDDYAAVNSYTISLILMISAICAIRMENGGYRLVTLVVLVLLTTMSKVSTGLICAAIVAIHLALFDPSTRIKRAIAGISMIIGYCVLLYPIVSQKAYRPSLSGFLDGPILKYGLSITGAAVIVSCVYMLLLRRKPLRYTMLACGICALSIAAYLWLHPQPLVMSGIQRLHFLRAYTGLPDDSGKAEFWTMLTKFTLVHFLFTWLLVVLAANLYYWDRDKARYLAAPLLYSLSALGISWAVLYFAHFSGGVDAYFSNTAIFIALPYLLTILSERISGRSLAKNFLANAVPLIVLTGSLLGVFAIDYKYGFAQSMAESRKVLRSQSHSKTSLEPDFAQIMAYLKEVRDTPSTKNLGVYIAKEEKKFWGDMPNYLPCADQPFVIPVVSERPGLLALPTCPVKQHGYMDYPSNRFEMSALARVSHDVLLKMAADVGLDGYVDVRTSGWTVYRNNTVSKPPEGGVKQ